MKNHSKYLLLIEGHLYGYNDPILVRIDAKLSGCTQIFKLDEGKWVISYSPIKFEELQNESEKA